MDYDRYASAVRAEYATFANELLTEYLTQTSAGRGLDAVGSFRLFGLGKVAGLLTRATALTNDYLAPTGKGTLRDTRDNPWLDALRQIAIKNLNDLIVRMMGGTARLANTLTRPAGAVGLLLQRKVATPELVANDKSGRKWPADKLVAVMARDFAYQAYLDAAIERFEAEGVEWVEVAHSNPDHPAHGTVMRIDEISLVRKSIFHPNSNARLVPYVPT